MVKQGFRHALMLALLSATLPAATVLAQVQTPSPGRCTLRIFNRAGTMYELERYDSTIVLLTPCLQEKRFSNEQEQRAYRLVALSYFANRDLESSKVWINSLVHEHRDYLIDPDEDPLFFQQWVDRYRPKKWHQKRSVRIGIPVVLGVLGTVGYLIFKTEPLPPLPTPPKDPPFPSGGN